MEVIEENITNLFLKDLERWDPLLVSLIRKNKIDPWSVDIESLSKAYLSSTRDTDFRKHGKTVLTLAILLKLKSENLEVREFWEEMEDEVWDEDEIDLPVRERPRIPKLVPIHARSVERRVTLGELVNALRAVMDQKQKRSARRLAGGGLGGSMEVRADLDIGRLVNEVYDRIMELCQAKGSARFSEVAGGTPEEGVWTLMCLLHLYFENSIGLEQEKWWGDIMITEVAHAKEE